MEKCSYSLTLQSYIIACYQLQFMRSNFWIFHARRYWCSPAKSSTIFAVVSFAVTGDKRALWAKRCKVARRRRAEMQMRWMIPSDVYRDSMLVTRDSCEKCWGIFILTQNRCTETVNVGDFNFFSELHPLFLSKPCFFVKPDLSITSIYVGEFTERWWQ